MARSQNDRASCISIACITEVPVVFAGGGTYALRIFSGIADECDALSVRVDIFSGLPQYAASVRREKSRYDGFILWKIHDHAPAIEAIARTRPSVWVLTPPSSDANAVVVDSVAAIHALIDHFLAEGFSRIGFFNTIDLPWANERFDAYRAYCAHKGIAVASSWVTGYSEKGRYDLSAQAWKDPERYIADYCSRNDRADAILCSNDGLAYRFFRYASTHGIHVPRDIALAGFDDRSDPRMRERVTTARTDFREIGRRAARLLYEIITGARGDKGNIIRHRAELVIRHTSLRKSFTDDMIRGLDFRERVYALVQERYRETKLSEALSASCGYSHEYFLIKFAKTFGVTFSRFIARYRVEKAKMLLRDTRKPVTEIVYESGFSHLQNFYTAFKRDAGMPPVDYRRRIRTHWNS